MVATDSIEGTIDNVLWFHYDIDNDTLYLRLASARSVPTYADEQPDGAMLLRTQNTDTPVGLTIINWWKQHGQGRLPDSLRDIENTIEPFARTLAA